MVQSHNLLFIDIQEKLFPKIFEHEKLLLKLQILQKASTLLEIPLLITEQYPQGLGKTLPSLMQDYIPHEKTTFSCIADPVIKEKILKLQQNTWIVAGIESHVCVLQTVKDLLANNISTIVLQDAIASRNPLDHRSAVQEMRAMGARITTTETLLFELMHDAKHPQFKAISSLIK